MGKRWPFLSCLIQEFKVHDPDLAEKTLEDTAQSALKQIEDKGYTAALVAKGFGLKQIRRYGFDCRDQHVLTQSDNLQ